jgi:hypothetical protein
VSRGPSIVAQRLRAFIGRAVAVHVTYASEPIACELVDVLPLGRDYFLSVRIDAKPRLISTRAVLVIEQTDG